jgi:2-dehydro-3-deoxyphosphooctonate aldolase (KDO 8-P synthase)
MKNEKYAVSIGDIDIGPGAPLALISGPCVVEDYETTLEIATYLRDLTKKLQIPFIFKASYDKANRTSIESFRGPGIREGLRILSAIRKALGIRVLSDVHQIDEIEEAAQVLDIIQIPAFLCRQTDFVLAVAKTGKPINIKKGQFLAPWDVAHVAEKAVSTGNRKILVTERGTLFGYNNLVSDFRGIKIMQDNGLPVIFDATHSVQLPGGLGKSSGGQREFAPVLAKAAVAAGADGIFMEVHADPETAKCDGPNSLKLDSLRDLVSQLKSIRNIVSSGYRSHREDNAKGANSGQ